jgi:phenylacetate-CoA ligase
MIWDKKIEQLDRKKLQEIQLERLQNTVHHVYNNVPFYRDVFDRLKIRPEDIRFLKDLEKLPFTTKDDVRDHYPYGLFAVPMKKIVRVHASSGTTGKPTVVGYTKKDLDTWTELVARMVTEAGAREDDIAQISFSYGLFTGAFGLHYGLEKVGAAIVPTSAGNTEKQLMLMRDFQTTVLISTPSYALYMAEVAEEMGIDLHALPLRLGLFGAEGCSEEMRREIEKRWGISATENYGLSEVMGPGVAGECEYKQGMHIAEDHFIPEIIDPHTGETLPYGEKGELVFTTITKEGLPLIRYRTKDISRLILDRCDCGRTMLRMEKVSGRTDDMLIIKGVNVFPSQIESVLMSMEEVGPHYQIIARRKNYLDEIEIHVEVVDANLLTSFKELELLERKVLKNIKTVLGIDAKIRLVEPRSIERTVGKAKRVIDLRNQPEAASENSNLKIVGN